MRIICAVLGLAFLTLPATTVFAEEATGVVEHRDTVYGILAGAGESHSLTFFATAGSMLKVKLKDNRKADPDATVSLVVPEQGPASFLKTAFLPVTGTYALVVTAAAGKSGEYRVKFKVKPAKKYVFEGTLPQGETAQLAFGGGRGADFRFKLRNAEAQQLLGIDGSQLLDANALARSKVHVLPDEGEYTLVVGGKNGGAYKARLKVKTPKAEKRERFISPGGFGPAPRIDEIDPEVGLVDSILRELEIEGFPFQKSLVDDSPPAVELKRKKTVLAATSVEWISEEKLVASFDLTGVKGGKWDLVVRNPSGGEGKIKFKVLKEGEFRLPDGVKAGTELWFVEFTDDFEEDLDLFQLRGDDDNVNAMAAEAVEAYVIYLLRTHFRLDGRTGDFVSQSSVPVSFVIDEVSQAAGFVGEDYNRLVIGGRAKELFDTTADNPFLNWGFVPLDLGNAMFDDVGGAESETTAHLPIREMNPSLKDNSTGTFQDAFAMNRLSADDEKYFLGSFFPATQDEMDRMEEIIRAVETLGREIAAIAAHHVGRAMGLSNSDSTQELFLSGTPDLYGQYSGDKMVAFQDAEIEQLKTSARLVNLPGKSRDLNANPFKLMPANVYLLPEVETNRAYDVKLMTMGGRPDLVREDLKFEGIDGAIPIGFQLEDGHVRGTAPFFVGATFYLGAFQFRVRVTDKESSDGYVVPHRINLLINESDPRAPTDVAEQNQAVRDTVLPGE
ncbi:MAG: hypothetical protein ACYS99_12380 [Planctomycetota bacterium]|jgi:hypothetical protein